jgi:hypothetical protein
MHKTLPLNGKVLCHATASHKKALIASVRHEDIKINNKSGKVKKIIEGALGRKA